MARDRIVPKTLDRPAEKGLSFSTSSCSVGKCDMPRGGWGVPAGGTENGDPGIVMDLPYWLPIVVLRLRRPSHSNCGTPSSLTDSSLAASSFSWRRRFSSSTSIFSRVVEKRRTRAAAPRMASALGSVSGCSCSAIVWIWLRSPANTAESGTSLADLDSWSRTTPEQIVRKPSTTVTIEVTLPLKPWNRTADVMIVVLVK